VHGYSLRYATAIEFSNKVLQASDKWNGDLHAYANYRRPDGTTYLEADQIYDHVRKDPYAIGYARYHEGFPKDIKVLSVAKNDDGSYVEYNIDTLQNGAIRCGATSPSGEREARHQDGSQVREFIRFVLSREGRSWCRRTASISR